MAAVTASDGVMSETLQREVAGLRRELQQLRVRIFGGSVAEARACGAFRFPAGASDEGRVAGLLSEVVGDAVGALRAELGPGLRYKGVYQPGIQYASGDAVTCGGSIFVAMKDTTERPDHRGESEAWRLACKRGRDGRDAGKAA